MANCRIEKFQDKFIIHGVLNFETVTEICKKGIDLLDASSQVKLDFSKVTNAEQVKLDFSKVTNADSSAIALLLNWMRVAKQKGKAFVFANLPSQLIEIANVCEVMPILEQNLSSN